MLAAKTKASLRRLQRERMRQARRAAEGERESRIIQGYFLAAFPPRRGERIALYAPVAGEVDTERIRNAALAAGALLYYPVLTRDGDLVFFPHGPGDTWVEGRFGLREPDVPSGAAGLRDGFDLIVVPGLAFDAAGRRLGQGYGSYDRFLRGLRKGGKAVGLAFSWQLVEEVPVDEWDVPVDAVVTAEGVVRAGRGLLPCGDAFRGVDEGGTL